MVFQEKDTRLSALFQFQSLFADGIISMVWGCFSRVELGPLVPLNVTLNASGYI